MLVVALLALQILVPLMALFGPRPARFSWQMYSALPPVPHAWTVAVDSTETPIDLGPLFAVQRAEIDYAAVLRAGLCDKVSAPAVKIQEDASTEPELILCR